MVVVPKKAFPYMWRKKKPPKVLYLYERDIVRPLGICECYTLTSISTFRGVKLRFETQDDEYAYYSGYDMTVPYNDPLSYYRNAFTIKWLGEAYCV